MDFLMYFEGQALYIANEYFHVLWVCVLTVFMWLLLAETSGCCFGFALQPLQVVLLEPARILSTWKTRSGFGFYFFFPQDEQLTCSGKSSLHELNGSIAQIKFCRESTCWYFFHRSTASGHKVLLELWDNWLRKCRQLVFDCFSSYCIGCRIKII